MTQHAHLQIITPVTTRQRQSLADTGSTNDDVALVITPPVTTGQHQSLADHSFTSDDTSLITTTITQDYTCPTQVAASEHAGVIGNNNGGSPKLSDPGARDPDDGRITWRHPKDSRPITWRAFANSDAARSLVARVFADVERWSGAQAGPGGKRRYTRSARSQADVAAVVEGFVGDLLINAAQQRVSAHPVRPCAFKRRPVGHRAFDRVRRALVALYYVDAQAGFLWLDRGWSDNGSITVMGSEATRFRPTDTLLALADEAGVRLAVILRHFRREPFVGRLELEDTVEVKTLSTRVVREGRRPTKIPGQRVTDFTFADEWGRPHLDYLRMNTARMNDFADQHVVTIGQPGDTMIIRPHWKRQFTHCDPMRFDLHGRWYDVGGGTQALPKTCAAWGRPTLRIDGEPVVEVDARASFLSLLHGYQGLLLDPLVDLYAIAGFGRAVVKAFVNATIGNGGPPRRWTKKACEDAREAGITLPRSVKEVSAAVLARYPFLARLPDVLGCSDEPRLCSHVLMGIESRVLTSAMDTLRQKGTLALPLHDALLVKASDAEAARDALVRAYAGAGKVDVTVRTKPTSAVH